jgi:hypothetical protein
MLCGKNSTSENALMQKINITACSSRVYLYVVTLVAAAVFFLYGSAQAVEWLSPGGKALIDKYHSIKTNLKKNQFGIPVYLESIEEISSLHVDIFGIFDYSFEDIRDAFQVPANWCDIAILHTNIKASTCTEKVDQWQVTLYNGLKTYQPPEDAFAINYKFRVLSQQPDYLHISLFADEGPLFTKNHRLGFEVAPLDKRTAFVHFTYSYNYNRLGRMAIKTYFATFGRNKKGFSIVATDKKGNPLYLGGVRGSVERNAVRYYFALQTYMDSLKLPSEQRFEKRINQWYDLTARYPIQLYELDKEDYLANKHREYTNQITLQSKSAR